MPSWVSPVLASEIWNIALDRVLEMIQEGSVNSRLEGPFMLVDVAAVRQQMVRRTWTRAVDVLTSDELLALSGSAETSASAEASVSDSIIAGASPMQRYFFDVPAATILADQTADEVSPPQDDGAMRWQSVEPRSDAETLDVSQWREIRPRTSGHRTPPRKCA